ncbi:hypothetical protein K0M31_015392, partial [Melipona bicolor]
NCADHMKTSTSKSQRRVVEEGSFGSQEATMTRERRAGRSIVSQREKRWPGRVVYFKFFQTLRRTRRERKKASVAKKRGDVGNLAEREAECGGGGTKEEKKGEKERKVSHRARERRYRAGNRAKKERKEKGRRPTLLSEPLDKFYI